MKSSYKILSFLHFFFLMLLIKGNNSNIEENYLVENETVQQYIIKGENNSYQISMDNKENLKKILIDLMIFSGDVIINFKEENENIHKYETSNKIFFSITTANITSTFLDFQVIALKHSYYSLRYTTIKKNQKESEVPNIIPSNTNFLITMYPFNEETLSLNSKIIKFRNEQNNNLPFLINFYSLNCAYDFFMLNNQGEKKIMKSKDGYFIQDIIKPSDERYETKEYSYITTLTSVEQGTYNKKMCMIYASSTDLENNILVGDNVPQKVIFNSGELTKIKYEYEIPDTINDLAIKYILSNRAEYQVNYYINNIDIKNRKTNISSNQQEIIESIEYSKYCSPDQENILIVEIELNNNNELNKNFELEVTIKSISSIEKYPSYLIKNKINSEYLNFQSPNYYYTDLGQKLSGEIIINYYRGNGMVFGKIVKKNKEPDSNPEWKGIYEFPKTVNGTLKYYSYLKKLSFSLEDTKDCEDECYLLINVINNISISDEYIYGKSRYFGFDILIVTNSPIIDSPNPLIILPLKQVYLTKRLFRIIKDII